MKILLVTSVDAWTRSVSTVHKWVETGRALGHEVAVYGYPNHELPKLPFTTDLKGVDLAVFVMQVTWDLPNMPDLARLLDGIPRERRVVIDLWGRYNDTVRLEHDFNHLEKVDGHMGWEWEDAFQSISGTILQPTLHPLRADVKSFLFHGYDPNSVFRNYKSAKEAAAAWSRADPAEKPYGALYIGSNWQRWEQVRDFLEQSGRQRDRLGRVSLIGWDWTARPQWAVELGILGINTDPSLLARLDVDVQSGVRFDEVVKLLSKARFAPVIHRPLFRHLGLVTNRTFETFHANALPVLLLPREFVREIYGGAALKLVPGDDVAAYLGAALERPEPYWEAVLETRTYLGRHHSHEKRFEEFAALTRLPALAGAAR